MNDIDAERPAPISYAPLADAPASAHRVWTLGVAYVLALVCTALGTVLTMLVCARVMAWRFALHHGTALPTNALVRAVRDESMRSTGVLAVALSGGLAFALLALVSATLSPDLFIERLRLGRHHGWFLWGIVAGFGAVGLGCACAGGSALAGIEAHGPFATAHRVLQTQRGIVLLLALVIVGVVTALGEELFFRGYVQTRLAERWGSIAAVLLPAALFAPLHVDLVHGVSAFVLAVYLGWVSLRTASIRTTMVAHVFHNLLYVTAAAMGLTVERAMLQVAVGLVMFAVAAVALLRTSPDGA